VTGPRIISHSTSGEEIVVPQTAQKRPVPGPAHTLIGGGKSAPLMRRSRIVRRRSSLSSVIRGTSDPPRPVEETMAVSKQTARGAQMPLTGAATLNRSDRQGSPHERIVSGPCKRKGLLR
jgi:hypothetical protein